MTDSVDKVTYDKLDENNYAVWSSRMRWLLVYKNLWDVVENSPGDSDADAKKKDMQALSLIGLSVCNTLVPYVTRSKTAKEAWDTLKQVFKARSNAMALQLTKALSHLALQDDESVTTYAARAKALWDQLVAMGENITERQIVIAMLSGLPTKEYGNVVQNILSSSDPLEVSSVVNKLLLVEQEPGFDLYDHNIKTQGAAFHSKGAKQDKECWYCHKRGHVKADCLALKRDRKRGIAQFARRIDERIVAI